MEPMEQNAGVQDPAAPDAAQASDIRRGQPEVDQARAALVSQWQSRIRGAKKHWEKTFKRMRDNQQIAREGADKTWVGNDNYTVPIVSRHINQQVAKLYAKNPTITVKPKDRLRFAVWDGSLQQLQEVMQAQMAAQAAQQAQLQAAAAQGIPVNAMAQPLDERSQAIIADIQQGKAQLEMLKRIAKTTEILWNYYTNEQEPNFKQQVKQLVRRTKINGVGYIWLSYQRLLEPRPEIAAQIDDVTSKITAVERMQADIADDKTDSNDPELEELRLNLEDLQNDLMMVVREGPVFDFPRSTEIIIDTKCRHLKNFIGARWIAREMHMDLDEVEENYKIDLRGAYTPLKYSDKAMEYMTSSRSDNVDYQDTDQACVWHVFDKKLRQEFTVIDGYKDFAVEPKSPDVEVEGFWPCRALTLNDIEDECELFPPSDVWLLRHPQREHNRARQSLREHRIANRPAYGVGAGVLSDTDKEKLVNRPANAVLELNAMSDGQKVDDVISAIKPAPIDPAVYDVKPSSDDIMMSVGAQQADIGGTSGDSATEVSVAEANHNAGIGSNVDDLEEFMGDVAGDVVQIMHLKVSAETAKEIAGPGAVWPDLDREMVVKELMTDIRVGSSGRPNVAAKLANFERAWPAMSQLPGLNPEPVIRELADLLDIPYEDLISEGTPSITAINAMMSKAAQMTPAASDAPEDQGGQGGANAPVADGQAPGAQPAYPMETAVEPQGGAVTQ